jgi:hypothetical protein
MIRFDKKTHSYFLADQRIPSVTQVINAVLSDGYDSSNIDFANAAIRGSKIHAVTAKIDNKDKNFSITDDIENYIIAYTKFLKDYKPKFDHVEYRLFNTQFQYAGTCDRIGFMTGMNFILDIKTGQVPVWAGVQLAAYREAYKPRMLTHRRFVLQLTKEGRYKLIKYSDPDDWKIFQAALAIYNWRNNNA